MSFFTKKHFLPFIACFIFIQGYAQPLISGPWAGNVELRTAVICMEVAPTVKKVALRFYPADDSTQMKTIHFKGELGKTFNPIKIELNALDFNTTYNYKIFLDGEGNYVAEKLNH